MSDEVKAEVIKKTQDLLGKYIKKPPLTEKLLKKPPFRFLHDIITNVIKETRFLEGLFTNEELKHENIKDRDSKIAFLQKLIDAVKEVTGNQLTVKPTKIVAGHEPSKTNELLQAIGKALDKKLDSAAAVEKLSTKKDKKSRSTSRVTKEEPKKTRDKVPTKNQSERIKDSATGRNKSNISNKKYEQGDSGQVGKEEPSTPSILNSIHVQEDDETKLSLNHSATVPELSNENGLETQNEQPDSLQENHEDHVTKLQTNEESNEGSHITQVEPDLAGQQVAPLQNQPEVENESDDLLLLGDKGNKSNTQPQPSTSSRPFSGVRSSRPGAKRPFTSRPGSARPPSARPAAPRIRDRGEVVVEEEIRPVTGKVNLIFENDSLKEQEEDENFVVLETSTSPLIEMPSEDKPIPEGEHGHLVSQILETQKELEEQVVDKDASKKVDIEWEPGGQIPRKSSAKDLERLKESIQTLTRAANPLGKLMEFLQEDIDSMKRELDMWKETNSQLAAQIKAENELTEQSLRPLRQQLAELDDVIETERDKIRSVKANILNNDAKIQQLLSSGSLS